jgi:hypothetical protein
LLCSIRRCRRIAARSRYSPKPICPRPGPGRKSVSGVRSITREKRASDKAAALFDQAVQAYRSALEVYTKADLPQDWARTQNNLGNALKDEGERASGDKAAALLDQAVQAYAARLRSTPEADFPGYWALTMRNLGPRPQGFGRHRLSRRRIESRKRGGPAIAMFARYDVFLSYSRADSDRVPRCATNSAVSAIASSSTRNPSIPVRLGGCACARPSGVRVPWFFAGQLPRTTPNTSISSTCRPMPCTSRSFPGGSTRRRIAAHARGCRPSPTPRPRK